MGMNESYFVPKTQANLETEHASPLDKTRESMSYLDILFCLTAVLNHQCFLQRSQHAIFLV